HVDLLRMLYGAGHTGEILHRPQTDVEVEHLAQGDIEGADAPANGSRERSFNADQKFLEGFNRVVRQPVVEAFERLLAREDLEPRDFSPAAVRLLNGFVEHTHAGRPDIRPGAVA